jgi:PKD repeat protein
MAKISKYRFNYSFLFWFIFSTLTFIFFPSYNASASTEVMLEWTPNSEDDLAGYKVFCREEGQSYNYANSSWAGTDNNCTIYDLDETKTYCFVARAYDFEGFESGDSEEVCHMPTVMSDNQPPISNAGPGQTVNEGATVSLDGSNSSDPDGEIASYHWMQTSGYPVILSDPNGQQQIFTAPEVGPSGDALTFDLTVVDHSGLESTDSCVVNVTWLNEPPQADAGSDQTVNENVIVTLDGSASLDIDDGIASFAWTQINGSTVILSDPVSSQPTFAAPDVGPDGASLTFDLTVTDTAGLKHIDSCIVNISWQNEPPTAIAAPDYIEATEGTLVTLDGSASTDSDDGIVSYLWSQIDGDPVSLSDPTSAVTTFTAPKTEPFGKNIKLKLTVKDHGGLKGTADSSIYVMQNELPNNSPAVDFSYATSRKSITFTDNSTDSDGTIVSWFWDFGDGHTSTNKNPSNWYRGYGTYKVTLTVTDDDGARNSQSKTVTFATNTKRGKSRR